MSSADAVEAERIAVLRSTELFGCLSPHQLASVAQRAVRLHFKKGEMLFLAGEEAKGLFVVVSGKIRAFQHNAEGREQVMHIDTAGSVIGEVPVFDDGPYPASAVAEEEVDALLLAKLDMLHFCAEYPALGLRALRLMAQRVRRHARLVETLSFHEVGQRLAQFLLLEAERCCGRQARNGVVFELAVSNHEIATRIGSVRDVVSRAFARLRHDGWIAVKGRRLTILDAAGLRSYAARREEAGEKEGTGFHSEPPDHSSAEPPQPNREREK